MSITIKRTLCPTGSVENSDATYSTTVDSGGSLVLPDSQINVNGVDQGDVVSVKTVDVNIQDSGGAVTPDSVSLVGNTLTVTVPSGGAAPVGATLMKTGQTTSYRTGDDGDIEAGRDTDFFTLAVNNPFGNTNRFTDELGGSTYTNNIVIDWSTYDVVAGTVLGYYYTGSYFAIQTWNDAIDTALSHSIGIYTSGWRLPNRREIDNIANDGISGGNKLNYAPFNLASSVLFWTGTTSERNNTTAYIFANLQSYTFTEYAKSSTRLVYFYTRTFTVTGTTLS